MKRMSGSVAVATVLLLALGTAAPAIAADGTSREADNPVATTPPAEPEETLTEGAPETQAPPPAPEPGEVQIPTKPPVDQPEAQPCEPGWNYSPTRKDKDYHKGVGPEQANYNGTSHVARTTFTSEVTGEVGVAVSGELKVGASVAVAEIEGKFGVELSTKLTAKMGNSIAVNMKPRKTTHGRYGVYRLRSLGFSQYTYPNCTKSAKKNVTIYTPRRVGWVIWES